MPALLIYATEVAAAIGRNRFKPRWEVFETAWSRIAKEQYETYISNVTANKRARTTESTREVVRDAGVTHILSSAVGASVKAETKERIASIVETAHIRIDKKTSSATAKLWESEQLAADVRVQEIARAAAKATSAPQVAVLQKQLDKEADMCSQAKHELADKLQATSSKLAEMDDVKHRVASEIRCSYGTARESGARDTYAQRSYSTVQHDNKFRLAMLGTCPSGREWGVGGRVDGIDETGRVIEIKNRTRRFFDTVPFYEMAQIQTYLCMLDAPAAVLVEQLNGEVREKEVPVDREMWENKIMPLLEVFARTLDDFVDNGSDEKRQLWVTRNSGYEKDDLLEEWMNQ